MTGSSVSSPAIWRESSVKRSDTPATLPGSVCCVELGYLSKPIGYSCPAGLWLRYPTAIEECAWR